MQRLAFVLGLMGSLGAMAPSLAAGPAPDPAFHREAADHARATRPPAARPPDDLRAPRARAVARRPPQPAPEEPAGARQGRLEGARAFDEQARSDGWRILYRAGIYDGQHAALDDPSLGRADYEEGSRAGRLDPGGRAYGEREGALAGEAAAGRDAPAQVERQFMDLAWKPVRSPRPAQDARFDGQFPATPAPELETLFREYPIARVAFVPRRMIDALSEPWSPRRLQGCARRDEVVSWDWQDARGALRAFTADSRRSGPWRALATPEQRASFEDAFVDGFDERLDAAYPALFEDAWRAGFSDGWLYGAFLRSEWSYRQGYAAGFDAGIAFAADAAFERGYATAYDRAYDAAFADWIGRAHTKILSARLSDGNDDGIFEPGETLAAEFVLANYGGVDDSIEAELVGAPLRAPASLKLRSPARRTIDGAKPLQATLAPTAGTPSEETLVLRIPGDRFDLPLRVSYPMEFTGNVAYESHALEGRAAIRFELVNRSRKPQPQVALVRTSDDAPRPSDRAEIGLVAPGETVEARIELEGIHPLELLGGTLLVRAEVSSAGRPHDHKVARFPELATRLDDPDLVAYLVRLGRASSPSVEDIAGARHLLVQRLTADWSVRAEEKGNSYESDLRDGGTRTAVGELVHAYAAEAPEVRRSLAFHGLDEEVDALAERLDGVHPNLRRSMRKLARRLES